MADDRIQRPNLPYAPDKYDAQNETAFRREMETLYMEVDAALLRFADTISSGLIPHADTHDQGGADPLDGLFSLLGHVHSIDDLDDVTETAVADDEILGYSSGWINRTLAEAGISAVGHDHDATYMPLSSVTVINSDPGFIVASDDTLLVDASGAAILLELPAAGDVTGQKFTIKKTDSSSNAITLTGAAAEGGEPIDGNATITIGLQHESYTVQSDGVNWWII